MTSQNERDGLKAKLNNYKVGISNLAKESTITCKNLQGEIQINRFGRTDILDPLFAKKESSNWANYTRPMNYDFLSVKVHKTID